MSNGVLSLIWMCNIVPEHTQVTPLTPFSSNVSIFLVQFIYIYIFFNHSWGHMRRCLTFSGGVCSSVNTNSRGLGLCRAQRWNGIFIALFVKQGPHVTSWCYAAVFRYNVAVFSFCLPSVFISVFWAKKKKDQNESFGVSEKTPNDSVTTDIITQQCHTLIYINWLCFACMHLNIHTRMHAHTHTQYNSTFRFCNCGAKQHKTLSSVCQLSKKLLLDFGFVLLMKGMCILLTAVVHHCKTLLSEPWWISGFYP